eukprot:gene9985-11043_t
MKTIANFLQQRKRDGSSYVYILGISILLGKQFMSWNSGEIAIDSCISDYWVYLIMSVMI